MSDLLFWDIETDGDPWTGRLLCVGWRGPDDDLRVETKLSPKFLDLLADSDVPIVEHSKYDARWFKLAGYDVRGSIIDTMTMAWDLDENQPLDLESLALRYLGLKMDKRVSRKDNKVRFKRDDGRYVPICEAPLSQVAAYCGRDVEGLISLHGELHTKLAFRPALFDAWVEVDVPFTSVLLDMEVEGMPVDVKEAEAMVKALSGDRARLRSSLLVDAGLPPNFNLNSGDQIAAHLFLPEFDLPGRVLVGDPLPDDFMVTKVGRKWQTGTYRVPGRNFMPWKRDWTKSGKRPKTDSATLAIRFGGDPWVRDYLEYTKLDTLVGFLESFVEKAHEGRLYANFNQTSTVTGRLSSSEPNMQNVPARGEYGRLIRGLFKGDLIIADYSQLEPRLMAHFSQDPALLHVFHKGLDVYRVLAQDVFGVAYDDATVQQRDSSKELLLAMGYGAMARKIAERVSVRGYHTTPSEAQRFLDVLQGAYSRFWEWKDETVLDAEETGVVYTIAGRARSLPGLQSEDWGTKTHGERQAVNSRIQGSAADIVKATMLEVRRVFPDLPLLAQVHDELVFEVPTHWTSLTHQGDTQYTYLEDVLKELQRIGENPPFELSVPLVFVPHRVSSWSDK